MFILHFANVHCSFAFHLYKYKISRKRLSLFQMRCLISSLIHDFNFNVSSFSVALVKGIYMTIYSFTKSFIECCVYRQNIHVQFSKSYYAWQLFAIHCHMFSHLVCSHLLQIFRCATVKFKTMLLDFFCLYISNI